MGSLNDAGTKELATAVLKSAVDDRDIDTILSPDIEFWCDLLNIELFVFRQSFIRLVKGDLDELRERRREDKKRSV